MLPWVLPICVTGVNSLVLSFGVSHGSRVFVTCRSRDPSGVNGYGASSFLLYKHALSRELFVSRPSSCRGWTIPTRFCRLRGAQSKRNHSSLLLPGRYPQEDWVFRFASVACYSACVFFVLVRRTIRTQLPLLAVLLGFSQNLTGGV